MRQPIRTIAVIGTGVIGASWAALFLAKGLKVVATDIADNAEAFIEQLRRRGLAYAGTASPCA
jgi:3-hydroxyacyl-CoA dehydrogenase